MQSTYKNWMWLVLAIVVVAAVLGIVFFMSYADKKPVVNNQNQNLEQPAVQIEGMTIPVTISATGFSPSNIIIKKGATVVWTNKDTAAHTVTATNNNGPHSPELSLDSSYSVTFATVGTYPYNCTFHPGMKGSVQVIE